MPGTPHRALCALVLALALAACSGADDAGAPPDGDAAEDALADAAAETARETALDALDADADVAVDATPDATDAATSLDGGTYLYTLEAGAFPGTGHPDVAVRVPTGFRPYDRVGGIVFFHGFNNCVANVIGSVNGPCTAGGAARTALHLADQLEAARVNAILFAVELRYDVATGDPGALGSPSQLRKLLHETLVSHLDAVIGRPLDVDDLERIVVGSHSGGYQAAAKAITVGGLPQLRQVDLYDSLYGEIATYDGWVSGNVARFDEKRADELRFADVYTAGGGTATNSRGMAARIQGWLTPVGLTASLVYDDTASTFVPATFLHPLIMKFSGLTHDGVPQYYFQRMITAAGFAPIP